MNIDEVLCVPEIHYLVSRECTPEWHLKPHLVSCYDITYLVSGSACYTINGAAHELAAGDLLCLTENMRKEARTYRERLMHCFSANFLLKTLDGAYIYPPFPLISHIGLKDDLIQLFHELIFTWLDQEPGFALKSRGLLLLILHRLVELTVYHTDTAVGDCRVKKASRYITRHFAERLTVKALADLVGLNAAYFGVLFKQETGVTVNHYIAKIRARNAKNLLQSGAYRVSEVAECCGYSDMFHFYKQFKMIMGIAPSHCIPRSAR
ncbi:MAG: AraC family transcriptional regulator [Treponema sp.]|jgi:AraC-like DNA-binding protein|nr:AraC family transcriptional regulator [Treponema sp.]